MPAPDHEPDPQFADRSFYLPIAVTARFRAAWWATRETEHGAGSASALLAQAMEDAAARLELEYNDGQPFPPAPPGARGVSREGRDRLRAGQERRWAAQREDHATDGEP